MKMRLEGGSLQYPDHRWHPKAILYEDDEIREQFYFENHPQTYATEAEANAVAVNLARKELRRRGQLVP
jgi:hypothetical protein